MSGPLYKTNRWKHIRRQRLQASPLCVYCQKAGKITGAEVVDHIIPHRGDPDLFHDLDNTQSLCKKCHDSTKKYEENRGYVKDVDLNGWKVDPRHPRNLAEE